MTLAVDVTLVFPSDHFRLTTAFEVCEGEVVGLSGPSGSGKTTLLRVLAGLERPTSGTLKMGDAVWVDVAHGVFVPPQARRIGFVFQDQALFPNMSVRENVAFGADEPALVGELLEATGAARLAARRPASLSGGERQRVALARALARRPHLLLLDEPLSALDGSTRRSLQDLLSSLHERYKTTTLVATHDPDELRRLCGRVLYLHDGRVTLAPAFRSEAMDLGRDDRDPSLRSGRPVPGTAMPATVASVEQLLDGRTRISIDLTDAAAANLAAGARVSLSTDDSGPR